MSQQTSFVHTWCSSLTVAVVLLAASWAVAERPVLHLETGGHTSQINWLQFTPDSQTLISAGYDQIVRLWDVRNPAEPVLARSIRIDRADEKAGRGTAFSGDVSPDGRRLALRCNNLVYLLDLQTALVIAVLEDGDRPCFDVAFSPDSRFLASTYTDYSVRVWDLTHPSLANRRALFPLAGLKPTRLKTTKFAPTKIGWQHGNAGPRLMAVGSGKGSYSGQIWALENGIWQSKLSFPSSANASRLQSFVHLACTADRRWMATSSFDYKTKMREINLWTGDGRFVKTLSANKGEAPHAISFSMDGNRLLAGSPAKIGDTNRSKYLREDAVVLSVPNGAEVSRCREYDDHVVVAAHGRLAASAMPSGAITLWDPSNGQKLAGITSRSRSVYGVAFSTDGQKFGWARNGARELRTMANIGSRIEGVFDLAQFRRANKASSPSVDWQDRRRADGSWTVIHNSTLVSAKKPGRAPVQISSGDNRIFNWSELVPGKNQVVVAGVQGVHLFDANTGNLLRSFGGTTGQVMTVAVSPDGRTLLAGGQDRTIVMWDLEDRSTVVPPMLSFFFPEDNDGFIAWSPDGYYTGTPDSEEFVNWATSRGKNQTYDIAAAWQFRKLLHRPSIVELLPTARTTQRAIALAATYQNSRAEPMVSVVTDQSRLAVPEVTITSPQNSAVVQDDAVTLKGSIQSKGALPIIELRVTVDKRPVAVHECQDIVKRAAAQSVSQPISFVLDVPLLPNGPNTIEVSAATQGATSKPVRVEVISEIKSVTKPNLYLLGIGVADYEQDDMKLAFPDDDVTGVRAALQSQQGRFYEKVVVDELIDDEVTERNIRRSLKQLTQNVTQHDVAIVMVSGHGHADDAGEFYFCPHDFDPEEADITGVPWEELTEPLTKLPCKVLLCIDTCYSAGVLEQKSNDLRGKSTARRRRSAFENAMSDLRSVDPALVVLTSSTNQQESFEKDEWGHGAFALSLVEVLTGKHKIEGSRISLPADLNKDRFLEISEIDSYVTARVKELTNGRQQPVTDRGRAPSFPIGVAQ